MKQYNSVYIYHMIFTVFFVALLQLFSGANTFEKGFQPVRKHLALNLQTPRRYPISKYGREHYLRQLNSRNITDRENAMFSEQNIYDPLKIEEMMNNVNGTRNGTAIPTVRIIIGRNGIGLQSFEETDEDEDEHTRAVSAMEQMYARQRSRMMGGGERLRAVAMVKARAVL